jgi:hypothetical protein
MNSFNLFLEWLAAGFLIITVLTLTFAVIAEALGYWDTKPKKP